MRLIQSHLLVVIIVVLVILTGCRDNNAAFLERVAEYKPAGKKVFDISTATVLAQEADASGLDVHALFLAHRGAAIADDLLLIDLTSNSPKILAFLIESEGKLSEREQLVIRAWFQSTISGSNKPLQDAARKILQGPQ